MPRPALMALLLAICLLCQAQEPGTAADYAPGKLNELSLPNAQWVTDKVISGASPVGDEGFAMLARLGVKTVISVDGAAPQIQLAHRHGLRYVHLPHGYDGIPAQRAVALAKAVHELPGPIYIHCHHGKHRSPAAAAVACVGAGTLPAEYAMVVLTSAGTSASYRGLYLAARQATTIDEDKLAAAPTNFPEQAQAPPLVDAMVAIERAHDHLLLIEKSGWRTPQQHPDLDPPHEALLLHEHYTELSRTIDQSSHSAGFWQAVQRSQTLAKQLEAALRNPTPNPQAATAAFVQITADCKSCHQTHRDMPLGEKSSRPD